MSDSKPPKQTDDFSEEVKVKIPELVEPATKDKSQLDSALKGLLELERKTRLAADSRSTCEVALAIVRLCWELKEYETLNDQIMTLSKKRAQLQKVISTIVQEAMKYLEAAPSQDIKYSLLKTLRTVAEGKLFLELEGARMTHILADMKEAEGKISDAADILQEVQVETIGSMEAREKTSYLLDQFRLCLEKKDFIRTEIIAKKISLKTIGKEEFQDLKLRFYKLMIQFHLHYGRYLDICKAYQEMYHTNVVQQDEKQWREILNKSVLFVMLAPFDSEVSDLLHRIKAEKKLLQLPIAKALLEQFTTDELMNWPLKFEKEIKADSTFTEEKGNDRWDDFHKRVVQHNIRVIAQYYSRISSKRFANLLQLDENKAEVFLSEMVTSKQLFAKIERPAGIITFARKKNANEILQSWSNDISKLLSLVENTCHLINKENMVYAASASAAAPEHNV